MVKRITGKRMYLSASPQRSSERRLKESFVGIHHAVVLGDGKGGALARIKAVWRNRVASAHAGIDGTHVGYFVHGERAAWAVGTFAGNHGGYHIEHANSSLAPHYRVSETTWRTGARKAGQRCFDKKHGRPKSGTTIRKHSMLFPTACPGPYMDSIWGAYVAEAADFYDQLRGAKTRKKFTVYVAKQPGDFTEAPVKVYSGPGQHYKVVSTKSHGDVITASGKTARTRSGYLWREGINGGWLPDRRLKEK